MHISGWVNDLRAAWRALRSRPGFTAIAVATLAIGIGASSTVFAFTDAVLLRPLPFGPRSGTILSLHWTHPTLEPDWSSGTLSIDNIRDLEATGMFRGVGGYLGRNVVLTGGSSAERIEAGSITPGLFNLLDVPEAMGRGFMDTDAAAPGFEQAVILSHGLWVRRFGADSGVVGHGIEVNGRNLTVVGVMPAGFRFPERDDLWLPYAPASAAAGAARNLMVFASPAPGVAAEQIDVTLANLTTTYREREGEVYRDWSLRHLPFRDAFVGEEAPLLITVLFGAVLAMLAIGCVNLANLLLAGGASRRREMAVRTAIGASRWQLVRQMLFEGGLVTMAGALLGVAFTSWAIDLLQAAWPEDLPHWSVIQIDARLLMFTAVVSLAATLMFGLWPALKGSRPNLIADLKESATGTTASGKTHAFRNGLVAAQIAVSIALLAGAHSMVRSALLLLNADAGFNDQSILSFRLTMAGDAYDPLDAKTRLVDSVENRLRELPGVLDAAAATALPIDDGGSPHRVALRDTPTPDGDIGATAVFITSQFFAALGQRVVSGREFSTHEVQRPDAEVVIVSRTMAREFWSEGSAVGQRIRIRTGDGFRWMEIVGVAPDVQFEEFGEETIQSRRTIYYPYGRSASRSLAFLVRPRPGAGELVSSVQAVLRNVDPQLPAYDLRTMEQVRQETTFEQRLLGGLMSVFSVIALFLASLGLYGVLSNTIRERTAELGIRMALGADTGRIGRMIAVQGGRTLVIGIAIGLPLAVAVVRLISGVLYGVEPADPMLFLPALAVLVCVAFGATWVPVRRATRLDPVQALRQR